MTGPLLQSSQKEEGVPGEPPLQVMRLSSLLLQKSCICNTVYEINIPFFFQNVWSVKMF